MPLKYVPTCQAMCVHVRMRVFVCSYVRLKLNLTRAYLQTVNISMLG